jgi:photosystem II stability/assembly factor-like uncharacterized protein
MVHFLPSPESDHGKQPLLPDAKEALLMRASLAGSIGAATISLLLISIFSSTAMADYNEWTYIGPNTNSVVSLLVDPIYTPTIYAITEFNGFQSVYKSIPGTPNGWNPLTLGVDHVYGFALEPTSDGHETLYAGTSNQVLKSLGGSSWTAIYTNLYDDIFFNMFAVDPVNTGIIYACTTNFGVLRSTDGGYGWDTANSGITASGVNVLNIDPGNHNTLYLGTINGIFKSTNAASTWVSKNSGLPTSPPIVDAIAINPLNRTTLYAGTSAGLYKSTSSGDSWTSSGTGLPTVNKTISALAIDPLNPAKVYAGTSEGVFRTTNAGTSWVAVNTGLGNTMINNLAIDPQSPDTLYAGTEGGVYKITFQDTGLYYLTYTKTGAGSGRVTSNPAGIDCADSCSAQFDADSQVNLHAEADSGSFFVGWTGACTGISADCTINPLNSDKAVSANFVLQTEQMVLVNNQYPWIYFSLQTAYNAAQNGVEMRAMDAVFVEDVNCNIDKSVNLMGGYDNSFDNVIGRTTLHGSLIVARGSLTVADLIIY